MGWVGRTRDEVCIGRSMAGMHCYGAGILEALAVLEHESAELRYHHFWTMAYASMISLVQKRGLYKIFCVGSDDLPVARIFINGGFSSAKFRCD